MVLIAIMGGIQAKATISFQNINVEHGLSQTTVYSIYQDEMGRMWFGTRDGLSCFDGNKIRSFKPEPNNPHSIFGNNIVELLGDQNGSMFIMCKNGLVILDLRTEQFRTVTDSMIYGIHYGSKLWCASKRELSYYDSKADSLVRYCTFDKEHIKSQIACIKEASDNRIYVGSRDSGLYVVDKNRRIRLLIPDIGINNIYEDSKRNIWVCTRQDGLIRIAPDGTTDRYVHSNSDPTSISSNIVRTIVEDDLGYYYVGTLQGLLHFDHAKRVFSRTNNPNRQLDWAANSVQTLKKDRQGSIWAGMFYGGVYYFNPEFEIFSIEHSDNTLSGRLPISTLGKMREDESGNLWICSEGGGLSYFNRATAMSTTYKSHSEAGPLSSNLIKDICFDNRDKNMLWVATIFSGINKFDTRTKKGTRIQDPQFIKGKNSQFSIRSMEQYGDTLFLATHSGLVSYNKRSGEYQNITQRFLTSFYSGLLILDMVVDHKNEELWASNSHQILRYDIRKDKMTIYSNRSIIGQNSYNRINAMLIDNDGSVWLGTSGEGMLRYRNGHFERFTTNNPHLDDGYILAMGQSLSGNILAATNSGLIILNPENRSTQLLNNTSDFPLGVINDYSLLVARNGTIFVGGTSGLVYFNESDLNYPKKEFAINVCDIEVNNIPLTSNQNNPIPIYLEKLKLLPSEKAISIEFSTTNYIKAIEPRIEYRLLGFEKEWIAAGGRRIITYTNLRPGNYTLQIRALDNISGQVVAERQLEIRMATPLMLGTVAITIYIILILGMIVLVARFYTSRLKLRSSLELEKREKEQSELMNQAKQTFFINVSHEFRTPTTIIMAHAESLLQLTSLSLNARKKVQSISSNALRTNRLINELLDFSRLESGSYTLNVSQVNIVELLQEVYLNFKEYARYRNIEFNFVLTSDIEELYVDVVQIEKVFYNIISNAFNYTDDGGSVTLSLQSSHEDIYIRIEDSGIGIEKELLSRIFERYFRIEREKNGHPDRVKGSGIGLFFAKSIVEIHGGRIDVSSTPNSGTTFTIAIPRGTSHLKDFIVVENPSTNASMAHDIELPDARFMSKIEGLTTDSVRVKLLIVEDNSDMAQLLVEIFAPIYNTIVAANGIEGLEVAIKEQPDMVLSDVMMPMMSGTEMCEKLKSNPDTSHIPIVLLTAKAAMDYKIEGLQRGADDYITKPFNAKELIARCNNIIINRQMVQRRFSRSVEFVPHLITNNEIDQKFLERLHNIIEENISNSDFSIETISRMVGMGRTNLFSKIKAITGMTPNDFVLNMRLKRAMELIMSTNLTISEIAFDTGFSSASYFIKCFKQLYLKTPQEVRKGGE